MIPPTVNILVRVNGNEKRFKRLLNSLAVQSYAYIRVIMAYDLNKDISYIPEFIEVIHSGDNAWNALKAQVTDGWFFFLDEEDYLLHRHVIANVVNDLFSPRMYICQTMIEGRCCPGWLQPQGKRFQITRVFLPCIWLHHTHRDLIDFKEEINSEWRWISTMSELVGHKYLQQLNVARDRQVMQKISQIDEYTFKEKFRFEQYKNKKSCL